MNLEQIINTERRIVRLEARLACMLEEDMRVALEEVSRWVSEIRHYAVGTARAPDAVCGGYGPNYDEAVAAVRRAYAKRLLQTFTPEEGL